MSDNGPSVTDHALVRWLERTGAMDVGQMRRLLSSSLARAADAAAQVGGGNYLVLADGMVFVIKDDTLITVLEDDGRHAHVYRHKDRPSDRQSDRRG